MKQKIQCGKLSDAIKLASSHGVAEINEINHQSSPSDKI
jgi:hypothetical protein